MNRKFHFWTALALVVVAGPAQCESPRYVRVVILDTSGSMGGPRLTDAIAEIREFARQLPPSAVHPIVLIPFHESAHDVAVYTDETALSRSMGVLQAGGGTSISAGLERALAELRQYTSAQHVSVMLYSDGEDDDQDGIARQEAQLDQVFGNRSRRGLQQSVVFCKRWEKANAQLLQKIRERGHARIVDAGELRLVPVTLRPVAIVTRVEWAAGQVGLVDVDLQAKVEMDGLPAGQALPDIRFTCRSAGVVGTNAIDVRPGGDPQSMKVRFPVDQAGLAAGASTLEFDVSRPGEFVAGGQLLLPVLPSERISVRIALPAVAIRCTVSATLESDGDAKWTDPFKRQASFPLKLVIDTTADPDVPWRDPLVYEVQPGAGYRLTPSGPVSVSGPGRTVIPMTAAAEPPEAGDCALTLTMTAATLPTGVVVNPQTLPLTLDAAVPPNPKTAIAVKAQAPSPPQWVDLIAGVAAVTVPVEFQIDGPLENNTHFTVQAPSAVRKLGFRPAVLTSGRQIVLFDFEAELPAAPASRELSFVIQPPSAQGAVRIQAPPPLNVRLSGPRPVQLALVVGGRAAQTMEIVGRNDGAVIVEATPALLGWSRRLAGAVRAKVAVTAPFQLSGLAERPVGVPSALELNPSSFEPSFFWDRVTDLVIEVEPTPRSSALVGSRQSLIVRVEAPFKRIAFYFIAALSAIVVTFVLGRLVLRLGTRVHE